MTDLIDRARQFATTAHRNVGQLRKYTGQPYEEHLRSVADMVSAVTDDAEVIAAAWLHDVVEDTPATIEEIERAFGPDVRALVEALTDVSRPRDGNRSARKALDRQHLARAPARAQTVKLADLLDNCQDICRHNAKFGRVYLAEMAALLEVLTAGDKSLWRRANKALGTWSTRLAKTPAPPPVETTATAGRLPGIRLRRALHAFTHGFRAGDVAEPLPADVVHPLPATQVLDSDSGLADVVMALTRHDYCFVTRQGEVIARIGRDEMQSPLARMWLFGMITTLELAITERIRSARAEPEWMTLLTPARVEKARVLQQSRAALGRSVPVLDCLQLSDKIRILLACDDGPYPLVRGQTKAESQRLARDLEDLRNNLVHAQDIVTHDWVQIARLAKRLEELAAGHGGAEGA